MPEKAEYSTGKISFFRTLLSWSIGILWTIFVVLLSIATGIFPHADRVLYYYARYWSRFLLWIAGIKVSITGMENTPKDHTVIVVSNHQSLIDIIVYGAFLPFHFVWIAKKELFQVPLFGFAMKKAGNISIDRQNREKAYQSLEAATARIRRVSVLIFPEGTRTRTGKLGRFKGGAIHMAMSSQLPILPITITNSFERNLPGRKGISPGTIHVTIDPEISTNGLNREDLVEIMKMIQARMGQRILQSQDKGCEVDSMECERYS